MKHVKFVLGAWNKERPIEKGTVLTPKKAVFGNLGKWQNFYTSTFTGGDVAVVGTQKGQLYVFEGHRLTRVIPQAHKGKVTAVFCLREHNVLLSGGDDGVVRFWRADDMSALHSIRIESPVSGGPAAINSITTDVKSKALVGTKCGEIWEISDEARLLVEAHGKGELWGLAIHPSDPHKLATCSDDGTVRLWNITPGKGREVYARAWPRKEDAKKIENSAFDTGCVRSVAWHPDGNSLAVGTIAGKVHVYELYSYKGQYRLTCIKELDTRNEWISDLKYSPCTPDDPSGGRYLAVGSHENAVDIYDTKKPNAEYELAEPAGALLVHHAPRLVEGRHHAVHQLGRLRAPLLVRAQGCADRERRRREGQNVGGHDGRVRLRDHRGVVPRIGRDGCQLRGRHRGARRPRVPGTRARDGGRPGYRVSVPRARARRETQDVRRPLVARRTRAFLARRRKRVHRGRRRRYGVPVGGDPRGKAGGARGGDDTQTKQTIEHDAEDIGK